MGIIARQGIKRSIISYVGVFIGMISIIFIYPLARDAYGYVQFLVSTSTILALILSFGSSGLVVRYFPEFKKDKAYLGIVFSFTISAVIFFSVIIFLLKDLIYKYLKARDFNIDLLDQNLIIIFSLSIFLILIQTFIYQAANYKRIVIPSIIHELSFKILLPILVLLYYFEKITIREIAYVIVVFYMFSFILNAIYVNSLGGISIKNKGFWNLPASKIKEMMQYMGFSGLNVLSANITTRIDTIMIPMLISTAANGTYTIFLFMSNTIAIPMNSLNQIASPVVSDSIKNSDYKNIENIYKKTSINSFIAGAFIFIIIWTILPDLLQIMPKNKDIKPYLYVFFFLGIAKLIDMLTSVNSYIIIYSKYYKYNLIFLIFLAVLNLILNYYLIHIYGITGAGIATMISITLYNLIKLIFIKRKFNLFPFTKNTIVIILIASITFIAGIYIPSTDITILNLIYKPAIIIALYYILIKIFKLKADIIDVGEKTLKKHLPF